MEYRVLLGPWNLSMALNIDLREKKRGGGEEEEQTQKR